MTIAQKKTRVDWCKEMSDKYDNATSKNVYKIVTADESWLCAYESETKQQATVWIVETERNPTTVVCGKNALQCMEMLALT